MAQIHYQNAAIPDTSRAAELYLKAQKDYNPFKALGDALGQIKTDAQAANDQALLERMSAITDANTYAQQMQDGSLLNRGSNFFGNSAEALKNMMTQRGMVGLQQQQQRAIQDDINEQNFLSQYGNRLEQAKIAAANGNARRANQLMQGISNQIGWNDNDAKAAKKYLSTFSVLDEDAKRASTAHTRYLTRKAQEADAWAAHLPNFYKTMAGEGIANTKEHPTAVLDYVTTHTDASGNTVLPSGRTMPMPSGFYSTLADAKVQSLGLPFGNQLNTQKLQQDNQNKFTQLEESKQKVPTETIPNVNTSKVLYKDNAPANMEVEDLSSKGKAMISGAITRLENASKSGDITVNRDQLTDLKNLTTGNKLQEATKKAMSNKASLTKLGATIDEAGFLRVVPDPEYAGASKVVFRDTDGVLSADMRQAYEGIAQDLNDGLTFKAPGHKAGDLDKAEEVAFSDKARQALKAGLKAGVISQDQVDQLKNKKTGGFNVDQDSVTRINRAIDATNTMHDYNKQMQDVVTALKEDPVSALRDPKTRSVLSSLVAQGTHMGNQLKRTAQGNKDLAIMSKIDKGLQDNLSDEAIVMSLIGEGADPAYVADAINIFKKELGTGNLDRNAMLYAMGKGLVSSNNNPILPNVPVLKWLGGNIGDITPGRTGVSKSMSFDKSLGANAYKHYADVQNSYDQFRNAQEMLQSVTDQLSRVNQGAGVLLDNGVSADGRISSTQLTNELLKAAPLWLQYHPEAIRYILAAKQASAPRP